MLCAWWAEKSETVFFLALFAIYVPAPSRQARQSCLMEATIFLVALESHSAF